MIDNTHGKLQVHMFPCLSDNYGYLVRDAETGTTAVIDTPDVAAIDEALARTGWPLDFIMNTHHHWDHAGGNLELKEKTGCTIVGPRADRDRIPGIDIELAEGDVFELGHRRASVYDTPGHTRGHICYLFADDGAGFVGDTLFAMGCGRLFEGTPGQMWNSLGKLVENWPDDTQVYCAHEYTQTNARFALTVEPGNEALTARADAASATPSVRRSGRGAGPWTSARSTWGSIWPRPWPKPSGASTAPCATTARSA